METTTWENGRPTNSFAHDVVGGQAGFTSGILAAPTHYRAPQTASWLGVSRPVFHSMTVLMPIRWRGFVR